MCERTAVRRSHAMTCKFFFFSEMGYNAYPMEALEQYGYSALLFPNSIFDAEKARDLWQMFLREHEYASEMGFDGSVCNEHHNNVLSMQESVNISAAVISQRIKGAIALIGNPLPIHDNPVRVAEEIAMLDLISGGRIISGFVRGAGILSPETIRWAARQRITYLVLGSALDATATCRDIYHEVAREDGWTPTPEHLGYLIHTAVMDTDEEAYEMGRYHYGGASVIGRSGGVAQSALSSGTGSAGATGGGPHPEWMAPPGYMSKQAKTGNMARERRMSEGSYEAAVRAGLIVTGSPKTIIQKFKHIIDRTDPGYLTFWAREGKKPHDATMRGIELLGKEIIPTLREHQSALVTGKEVTPWPQ